MDAGHDSLVTVRLSEPPILTVDTTLAEAHDQPLRPATMMSPNDGSIAGTPGTESTTDTATPRDSVTHPPNPDANRTLEEELGDFAGDDQSRQSISSEDLDEVDWEQLERTEDEQTKDEETDNVRKGPDNGGSGIVANSSNSQQLCYSHGSSRKTLNWLPTRRA